MKSEELESNSSVMMRRLADGLERMAMGKYKVAAEHPDLKISATWNINSAELLEQIAREIRSSLI